MKFLKCMRDGGPESPVIGYFLVEIKSLFSIVLLRFTGTRESFHSHAFNALTIWLKGAVTEEKRDEDGRGVLAPWTESSYWHAGQIKYTPRNLMHRIQTNGAWALSFRGPWAKTWREYLPQQEKYVTLTHGRKVVE